MTLARTHSISLVGVQGHAVEIEADIENGLVALLLVGLPDTALREADLTDADLEGANLSGCDLFQALTAGAKLANADLRGAEVSGLDLAGLGAYEGLKISLAQRQTLLTAMGLDVYAD